MEKWSLTNREREVTQLMPEGLTCREIAKELKPVDFAKVTV